MTKARDLANASTALSAVSATELGYLDGVTSAVQTQMDAKAPSSTAVTLTGTQTLTNKTLTSPALTTPTISTATTNGDILYGTGSGALARLGIGTTGQVLNVSGGVPAWATAASGGSMTLISSTALSGTSVSFTSIAGTYKNLYVHLSNPYASSNGGYNMTFNNDTTSTNYNFFYSEPDNVTVYANHTNFWSFQQGNWGFCSGGAGAASNGNAFHLWIYDYAGGTKKVFNGVGWAQHSNGNSQMFPTANGVYRSNTAITRLDVRCNAGTWSGGTAYLYGVN